MYSIRTKTKYIMENEKKLTRSSNR
ncbi:PspC domain-containing protein, partial [Phocaeicola vulgatus]